MTFIDELENTEILKELKNTDNAGCLKKKKNHIPIVHTHKSTAIFYIGFNI